jgi:uncharacterized membrane protein YedE/YeeE
MGPYRTALVLAVVGLAGFAVAVGDPEVLGLVAGWALAIAVIALLWARWAARPAARAAFSALLLPALVLLATVGGLFLVPAAIALLVASVLSRTGRPSRRSVPAPR